MPETCFYSSSRENRLDHINGGIFMCVSSPVIRKVTLIILLAGSLFFTRHAAAALPSEHITGRWQPVAGGVEQTSLSHALLLGCDPVFEGYSISSSVKLHESG